MADWTFYHTLAAINLMLMVFIAFLAVVLVGFVKSKSLTVKLGFLGISLGVLVTLASSIIYRRYG